MEAYIFQDLHCEAWPRSYHSLSEATPRLKLGGRVSDDVHISCINEVTIDVLMGSRVYISDHNHGIYRGAGRNEPPARRKASAGARYGSHGENAWIGDNVLVWGHGAIVGANSVPMRRSLAGNPAKTIKTL